MKINQLCGCCQGCFNTMSHAAAWCGRTFSDLGSSIVSYAQKTVETGGRIFHELKQHSIQYSHVFGWAALGCGCAAVLLLLFLKCTQTNHVFKTAY